MFEVKTKYTFISFILLFNAFIANVDSTAEVMKDLTLKFGEALEHCRVESKLTNEMMEEFFHFWREDFKFIHKELGCAILCMSRYFNLLNDDHSMHHGKADEFIKSLPDGEKLARKMIDMIHACEKNFENEDDHCYRVLKITECFKNKAVGDGIAPNMEMMMAEMIMASE